jgi:multicomponent K+:H+ antiporter subunit G
MGPFVGRRDRARQEDAPVTDIAISVPLWAEAVIAVLALAGAAFTLIGSWGLAKLGDFGKRLHGPTKATTLGVGCLLLASMLWFGFAATTSLHEALIALFLFLTAPVSAHLLIKAAMRLGATRPPPPPPR